MFVICTIPLDTAKVRLQLQKKDGIGLPKYKGMLGTVATIAREEGLAALWKGIVPGALAISVANPTDLVKVRLQAEGKLAAGMPRRYSGALNAYSTIARQEGIGALWTGRRSSLKASSLLEYNTYVGKYKIALLLSSSALE
ncbi:hypothetical protein L1987_21606 [Smallanthus sonchifolius]|uniref:Uncharacterized protein n=1 Tax=Smallanthus sonchifolius TaxID=185202 RepID=A0ACB9IF55_9ASTR|nr:hypothetical protein L1987_21606 [Smallanthus sonchifolius]